MTACSQIDLVKKAITVITHQGLAPLQRIHSSCPKDFIGGAFARWETRRREVEEEVADRLRTAGAQIEVEVSHISVTMADIKVTSSMGLWQALKHWKNSAERCVANAKPHSADQAFTRRHQSFRRSEQGA